MVAWVGGPPATELSRLPRKEVERRAVLSLATILSMKPAAVSRELVAIFHHDWINDPFSRGVYSYSRVGGARACETLSRPVRDMIWFAGEALIDSAAPEPFTARSTGDELPPKSSLTMTNSSDRTTT